MSTWHSIAANRDTEIAGPQRVSLLTQLTSRVKRFAILLYILAVFFSALVVPFFRESIIESVKKWLVVAG